MEEMAEKSKSMKTYIFYHCTTIGDYHQRFLKTYFKAKLSGLIDRCTRFFVCINGLPQPPRLEKQLFQIDDKIKTIVVSEEKHPNESVTANTIKHFCDNLEDRANILYIHNKGVTKPNVINVQEWVDYMEYFVIEQWKDCLMKLRMNDKLCVGTEAKYGFGGDFWHYSGGFWWAQSEHIKTLPLCSDGYFDTEQWILKPLGKDDFHSFMELNKEQMGFYEHKIKRKDYENVVERI
jgi:hypothetical protein